MDTIVPFFEHQSISEIVILMCSGLTESAVYQYIQKLEDKEEFQTNTNGAQKLLQNGLYRKRSYY